MYEMSATSAFLSGLATLAMFFIPAVLALAWGHRHSLARLHRHIHRSVIRLNNRLYTGRPSSLRQVLPR